MAPHRPLPRLNVFHAAPLLIAVLIALRASEPIRDNSFLWHIRAGTLQIDAHRVLTSDPFSFTAQGEAWRTQSWLLELGYGWAERTWSSLAWANWLILLAGILTFVFIGLAVYTKSPSPLVVTATLVLGVWLFAPFAQARPVVVSYVLLAAIALVTMRRGPLLWTLVPLFWVFAAVHGSWLLAGGLVALETVRSRDRRLLTVGAVSLGFTLLTAHGVGAWEVIREFFESRDALALIQEWMPPAFGDIVQAPYLFLVVGIMIGLAKGRIRMPDLIVVLPFLLYGMTSQRAVFPAAIVLLPYAAMALPVPARKASASPRMLVVPSMVAIVSLALMLMIVRTPGTVDEERFPADHVVAAVAGLKTFHDTLVGGYLIYKVGPGELVYVDDRAELYGFDRFDTFKRTLAGDYRSEFAIHGIEAAILELDAPLRHVLEANGWVTVATSSNHMALIAP